MTAKPGVAESQRLNLLDPDTFRDGVPFDYFERLRRDHPVSWHPGPDENGFFALSRYRDIARVAKDPTTFSSNRNGAILVAYPPGTGPNQGLTHLDPPRQRAVRQVVQPFFGVPEVEAFEPVVRHLTRRILDRIAPRGEADCPHELAALPMEVTAWILGVAESDLPRIRLWSDLINGAEDPEFTQLIITEKPWENLCEYGADLVRRRRQDPKPDLMSALARAQDDGVLSQYDVEVMFVLLAVAGNDTTRDSISKAVELLTQHPGQRDLLHTDPLGLSRRATEEVLRMATPVLYFSRTATSDTEIAGVSIPEGAKVAQYYISANFDEEVFPNPTQFDVTRSPNPHVTFGAGGPHVCLGAPLARLELRVMIEELMTRLPDIEVVGPGTRLRSHINNGYKHLPVRFTAVAGTPYN